MIDPNAESAFSDALRGLVSERAVARYLDLVSGTDTAGAAVGDDPAVDELVRVGLVGIVTETGEPFVQPPRLALARAIQSATQTWLADAPDIPALTKLMDAIEPVAPIVPSGPTEVDDLEEKQRAIERLAIGAVSELAVLQPYHPAMEAADAERWTSQPDAVMPSRVICRTVYDERLFRVENFEETIHEEVALGAQIRIAATALPGFLMVADRQAAAYTPAPGSPGRVTDESSLVAMLHLAFEATWSASTPFRHDAVLSDDHLTVLTLVGLGHTNRQIGSMLGLNERTIRRRVNDLLDHFGEAERAALVRHAHMSPSGA